jgi:hypothetical protein
MHTLRPQSRLTGPETGGGTLIWVFVSISANSDAHKTVGTTDISELRKKKSGAVKRMRW